MRKKSEKKKAGREDKILEGAKNEKKSHVKASNKMMAMDIESKRAHNQKNKNNKNHQCCVSTYVHFSEV